MAGLGAMFYEIKDRKSVIEKVEAVQKSNE
jgi:hypothetical protein